MFMYMCIYKRCSGLAVYVCLYGVCVCGVLCCVVAAWKFRTAHFVWF